MNYNSEADFYGAISGKYVDINSDAELHYDEALGKHKVYTGTTLDTYIVKSWQEVVPSS